MTHPAAPYSADARAKGWRFELDHERIRQSDTWALATADLRPWLLMLWLVAWEQTPCGSLPSDDDLIAARIGMAPKQFAKHRPVLMRGWWLADDGRLYHKTMTERVDEMLEYRATQAARKADYRRRMEESRASPAGQDTGQDKGQHAGQTHDSSGRDDTGTGTGTGTGTLEIQNSERGATAAVVARALEDPEKPEPETPQQPSAAGRVCLAMRRAGLQQCNPGDPRLLALLEQGATEAEFAGIAAEGSAKGKGWAWVLTVLQARRGEAAAIALAAPVERSSSRPDPERVNAAPDAEATARWVDEQRANAEAARSPESQAARAAAMAAFRGKVQSA